MSDTYRPPAEMAALDQAGAFIREEADRQQVALLIAENPRFCAGVSFGVGMMLRYAQELRVCPPLPMMDLADAWQDLMARKHGA